MKAIETHYKGYRFRSRLEARWAVFFSTAGVPFEYEVQGFAFPGLGAYLPDFWLPREKMWVEVKPEKAQPPRRLYLAGKMHAWRHGLDLRGHRRTGPHECFKHYAVAWHNGDDSTGPKEIIAECQDGIGEADTVLAWIDSTDCYGTLVEIGYARGLGKPILCAFRPDVYASLKAQALIDYADRGSGDLAPPEHAMWFVSEFCRQTLVCEKAQEALDKLIPAYTTEEAKCHALATQGASQVALLQGDPFPDSYSAMLFHPTGEASRAMVWETWSKFLSKDSTLHLGFRHHGSGPDLLVPAYQAARSARFEHGERPS